MCLSMRLCILLVLAACFDNARFLLVESLSSNQVSSRRQLLATVGNLAVLSSSPSFVTAEDTPDSLDTIYQLKSGVQFRNVRIGSGPVLREDDEVVVHVSALLRDGRVLIDTRQDGAPLVYSMGSALRTPAPALITPGLDDALSSRGVTTTGQRVEPMRQGSQRMVVVPAPLAYGHDGVSRYQAWQLGGRLRHPVPRDEMIRYEIEVLRCLDVPLPRSDDNDDGGGEIRTVQACCTEEAYPCPVPKPQ